MRLLIRPIQKLGLLQHVLIIEESFYDFRYVGSSAISYAILSRCGFMQTVPASLLLPASVPREEPNGLTLFCGLPKIHHLLSSTCGFMQTVPASLLLPASVPR